MKRRLRARLASVAIGAMVSVAAQAVEVGEPAPDFTLSGSDGQTYTLSELRGQHVVIAFFPKAFTGG
jgi:peroxiredoxin Q/BCP